MQVGRVFVDAIELRGVEQSAGVVLGGGAHLRADPVGVMRLRRVAGVAAALDGNRAAVVRILAIEDGLAALLRLRQLSVGREMPVGRERNVVDVSDERLQLLGVESLRAEQKLGDARAALRGDIGIVAIPLVGGRLANSAQRAVGHTIAPQLGRLEIPRQAVQVRVRMAGAAGKLALEAILRGVE